MTTIPAMCENGHYYLDTDTVSVVPGGWITFEDVETGPCPVCGACAVFENGVYSEPATLRQRIAFAAKAIKAIVRP